MKLRLISLLSDEKLVPLGLAAIAAAALGLAFLSEYVFGLDPCVLCLYQRIPYGIVIGLGFLAFAAGRKHKSRMAGAFTGAISLTLLVNSAIAFYHTGVEQKWWASHVEGCAVPLMKGNITDVLAQIEAAPIARCDEIAWQDPVLGLSMANYNVVLCLVLGVAAAVSAVLITRQAGTGSR